MTQFNNELYAGFLPEAGDARFEGKRGFYPAMTAEEYRALPLPMKCATWDARVQYVIFDSYFRDYELSGKVEVHNYIDGDEVASRTNEKVSDNLAIATKKRR